MAILCARLRIAYLELLAALFGLVSFAGISSGTIVRLNKDNTVVVAWLKKGDARRELGRIVSGKELIKKNMGLNYHHATSKEQKTTRQIRYLVVKHLSGC